MKRNASSQNGRQEGTRKSARIQKREDDRKAAEKIEAAESLVLLKESNPTTAIAAKSSSPKTFRWNDLPGEIKNRIYEYALEDANELVICFPQQPVYQQRTPYCPHRSTKGKTEEYRAPNLSLLRVSKEIYTESRLFLYQGNTIRFGCLEDFHSWVHNKSPISIFVKNSVLWYEYHGKKLTWEMAIDDGDDEGKDSGLVLSPVQNDERAHQLEETSSVVSDDFCDSLMKRMPPITFNILMNMVNGGQVPTWPLTAPPTWRTYPSINRRLPGARGMVVELKANLSGFWLKWTGLRYPIQCWI